MTRKPKASKFTERCGVLWLFMVVDSYENLWIFMRENVQRGRKVEKSRENEIVEEVEIMKVYKLI